MYGQSPGGAAAGVPGLLHRCLLEAGLAGSRRRSQSESDLEGELSLEGLQDVGDPQAPVRQVPQGF